MIESRITSDIPPTHRLTVYLPEQKTITTDTSEPEQLMKTISDFMHQYYKPKWWKRKNTAIKICGSINVIVPIEKIICCTIEELPKKMGQRG